LEDADHLGWVDFGDQIGQLMLEHHQAERNFEDLPFGISAEIFFQMQFFRATTEFMVPLMGIIGMTMMKPRSSKGKKWPN
jgi:hypothetical protein